MQTKKPAIIYPSALEQKILLNEATGGHPVTLTIVIPSITHPEKACNIRIAVLDANGYPSVECHGNVKIHLFDENTIEIPFEKGVPAVARVENVVCVSEGLFRLKAEYKTLTAHSNPTLCTSENVPGIYWGDPHVHTILSSCHYEKCRSLNFCYTAARYVSALDWVSAADHVSNGRCSKSKWKEQRTVANLYNDPPGFATLPAYEASLKGGAGGDNNVYMSHFPEEYVDEYEEGTVKTLCMKLADKLSEKEFFVVPHHTTRTGKHGEIPDDIYPGPNNMPVIEIHSKWGTSEYRGNPNPLKEIHDGPSYAADFLKRGMTLGFIAGTDTHATMPSGGGEEPGHIDRLPGLTAVQCAECTRQSIFDAIRTRHCYAASCERIILHGSIAGHAFGEDILFSDMTTAPLIDVSIAAQSDIERVEIVRNGEIIYTHTPDTWHTHITYEDTDDVAAECITAHHKKKYVYYYIRVTCTSGAQAWSSPVWLCDENKPFNQC